MLVRDGFDVVVVGGGTAGSIAAIAAARTGAKTLLIEQYGSLGGILNLGMSLKGVNDGGGAKTLGGIGAELIERARKLGGATTVSWDPRHGSIMGQDPEVMKMSLIEMLQESGVHLLLHTFLVEAVRDGDHISAVQVVNKNGMEVIHARTFVDCTGDADLVARAKYDVVVGREEDALMQPVSTIFRVGGVQLEKTWQYLENHPEDLETPEGWSGGAYDVDFLRNTPGAGVEGFRTLIQKAREAGDYHIPRDRMGINPFPGRPEVTINITRVHGIDGTNADDLTRAEVETQLQMLEAIRFLRKYVPGFENAYVVSSPFQVGVRETRHIIGDYILTKEDILQGRDFHDQVGRGAYPLDIHDVKPDATTLGRKVEGRGVTLWRIDRSYGIPARSLVPRGAHNVTVGGRAISATHEASGSVRGQAVCMVTGHAAGTMAALAALKNCKITELSVREIQSVLRSQKAVLERPQ
ncbi:FAD-dependent oxidoreductase [Alicyclobacillus macrosporangiidus]|uniref:FAD-dependent oxidoreductase n=1 Tax=Alicyclobacillus macrosporangiidus TaxID=392015 RepID=UPI0009DCB5E1|nr:FAD-dependent oxidoreductase [Alicyclobacillus macrosporangiidus]